MGWNRCIGIGMITVWVRNYDTCSLTPCADRRAPSFVSKDKWIVIHVRCTVYNISRGARRFPTRPIPFRKYRSALQCSRLATCKLSVNRPHCTAAGLNFPFRLRRSGQWPAGLSAWLRPTPCRGCKLTKKVCLGVSQNTRAVSSQNDQDGRRRDHQSAQQ